MSTPIELTIDQTATVSRIRWRVASSGPWPAENTFEPPFERIVIQRPHLTDIEVEVSSRDGCERTRRYTLPGTLAQRACSLERSGRRRYTPGVGPAGSSAAGVAPSVSAVSAAESAARSCSKPAAR
jgi:hypothetical protein